MARIEFWRAGAERGLQVALDSDAVPREGELISIKGTTWLVIRVTWAVDHADDARQRQLRANVEMEEMADNE